MDICKSNIIKSIDSDDLIVKGFNCGLNGSVSATLFYLDGFVNKKNIDDNILRPLLIDLNLAEITKPEDVLKSFCSNRFYQCTARQTEELDACIADILSGCAVIVFDKLGTALIFEMREAFLRSIGEPTDENVLKGAKDCFVENLRVNTTTIRSRIKTKDLRIKQQVVGRQTKTNIAIVYIEGLTNTELIEKVKARLDAILVDGVLSAGVVEEAISDHKLSIFPQAEYTERPDKLCANVLEGRIGIIVDGLPTVFIVPALFNNFMQAPEDYSFNFLISSAIRVLRYVSLLIAILLPAYYIAITTYHPEMIPSALAFSIVASKQSVPFPSFAEVLFMLIAFELLQEAGLRIPKTIGSAVSIVGGLIIGEAAVSAQLLSPAVIVVVAIAGIASYIIPKQDFTQSVRILRIIFAFMAMMGGFLAMASTAIIVLLYLSGLESFGVPYLAPYVSCDGKGLLTDTIVRPPLSFLKTRPKSLNIRNKNRKSEVNYEG